MGGAQVVTLATALVRSKLTANMNRIRLQGFKDMLALPSLECFSERLTTLPLPNKLRTEVNRRK